MGKMGKTKLNLGNKVGTSNRDSQKALSKLRWDSVEGYNISFREWDVITCI